MGPENSGGPFVAYFDGQPVELAQKPIQFTVAHLEDGEIVPDYSAGGISAKEASAAMATVSKAWGDVSITMEVAAEGIAEFFRAMELASAVWLARIFEPEMVHRYRHTKKKRTRKKYEKRILAWFGEVWGKCSD